MNAPKASLGLSRNGLRGTSKLSARAQTSHEGVVFFLEALADGTVSGVNVSQSSGSDRLDDAADRCHYRPAIKDGQHVDMPMTVKVDWKLDGWGCKSSENSGNADQTNLNSDSCSISSNRITPFISQVSGY